MCMPPIALGLSIKRSAPWHAFQELIKSSSIHSRNYDRSVRKSRVYSSQLTLEAASRRKENVNMSCSTHRRMISAGSPATRVKSIPCFRIHGSNSACVAIVGLWPSAIRPLQSAIYGCTSPRDPIVKQVIFKDAGGLKLTTEACGSSNMIWGSL